jgi:hypothetical protein
MWNNGYAIHFPNNFEPFLNCNLISQKIDDDDDDDDPIILAFWGLARASDSINNPKLSEGIF